MKRFVRPSIARRQARADAANIAAAKAEAANAAAQVANAAEIADALRAKLIEVQGVVAGVKSPNGTTVKIGRIVAAALA